MSDERIVISVASRYLQEQSQPEQQRFAFAYTVTIHNTGPEPVRLLARYWRITDGNNRVEEVRGPGVVGQTPMIAPDAHYRYTSGAVLETAIGTMEGSYEMITVTGTPFIAAIPLFQLARPGMIH